MRHADSSREDKKATNIRLMANGKEVLPELLKLPASQCAELAIELILSLDETEDSDAEEAWEHEIGKRAEDVISGRVKTVPWAKARKRIEALPKPR